MDDPKPQVACPFVYSDGKVCPGHIVGVEATRADLTWRLVPDGWAFDFRAKNYLMQCSAKGWHSGPHNPPNYQMSKPHYLLPPGLWQALSGRTA